MKGIDADGMIAARRCLAAMDGCDVETRKSLWRAASRFAAKGRQFSFPPELATGRAGGACGGENPHAGLGSL